MSYSGKKLFDVPGPRGLEIVRAAIAAGSFESVSANDQNSARKVDGKGYLTRDPKNGALWYPTQKARDMLIWLESQIAGGEMLPATVAPQAGSGVAKLQGDLDRANALFAAGDVSAARLLAEAVYEQAKAGGKFSSRFDLKESLDACRRIQADALKIEIRFWVRVAEEREKAKSDGNVLKGRPKSVPDENAFTAEELGFTRKQFHYAKELLEAERKEPGIAERAIAARLAQGLEPTRSNLRASIGTKTATKEGRGDNLYETPPEAVHALLALEEFTARIWEPACGKGAILRVLEDYGHEVLISDLNDYGTVTRDGECQDVEDFLSTRGQDWPNDARVPDIITNPPYGEVLNAFVAHALREHRPRKMALLLNANFWFGFDDPDREFALCEHPPARKLSFKRRLPMMHRDGWTGPKASSSMNTAWFIWELQPDGTYGNQTVDIRIDWKDHVPAALAQAADAAESEAA